jgi:hypothetical protein
MLPKNLNYQNKVNSAPAKSYKSNIQPQNGTAYPDLGNGNSNILYFNIPTRNNLTMDTLNSYLRFDLQYTNKSGTNQAGVVLDKCGAHGLIQRIRIYHGSNLLEDIDNYGMLVKMLYDLQLDYGSAYGKYNITTGTKVELTSNALGPDDRITNSGEALNSGVAIPINSISPWRTYCLNLISIMGSLTDKYFPLFECTTAPIRLEIWLVDNVTKAFLSTSATASVDTYSLKNVEFVASMVEISDEAVGIVRGASQGQLQYVINGWRNYGWVTPQLAQNATTEINMPIPAKFSSLKGLFSTFRDQGTGAVQMFPYSSGTLGTFNQYYFRIGSIINPPKAPYSLPEAFCELMKGIQPLGDVGSSPTINLDTYNKATQTAITSMANAGQGISNSFYIGLDLENYPASEKGNFYSGYNTNTDDVFLVYNFTVDPSLNNKTARIDTFAHFDALLEFSNGTCYLKF